MVPIEELGQLRGWALHQAVVCDVMQIGNEYQECVRRSSFPRTDLQFPIFRFFPTQL